MEKQNKHLSENFIKKSIYFWYDSLLNNRMYDYYEI